MGTCNTCMHTHAHRHANVSSHAHRHTHRHLTVPVTVDTGKPLLFPSETGRGGGVPPGPARPRGHPHPPFALLQTLRAIAVGHGSWAAGPNLWLGSARGGSAIGLGVGAGKAGDPPSDSAQWPQLPGGPSRVAAACRCSPRDHLTIFIRLLSIPATIHSGLNAPHGVLLVSWSDIPCAEQRKHAQTHMCAGEPAGPAGVMEHRLHHQ